MKSHWIFKAFASRYKFGLNTEKSYLDRITAEPQGKVTEKLSDLSESKISFDKNGIQPIDLIEIRKKNLLDLPSYALNNNKYHNQNLKNSETHSYNSKHLVPVPFPKTISDLDLLKKNVLSAGIELQSDHPGFHDPIYRLRREEIASISLNHSCLDMNIPIIDYTPQELSTWRNAFDILAPLHNSYACEEYREYKSALSKYCGLSRNNIPQLRDISQYLMSQTGFRISPVAGLLTPREFLNFLAFRVFPSTQYIRHHSVPMFTPEPDVLHEIIGHAPLLAHKDFADMSQQIGLASLGLVTLLSRNLLRAIGLLLSLESLLREVGMRKKYMGRRFLAPLRKRRMQCRIGLNSGPSNQRWFAMSIIQLMPCSQCTAGVVASKKLGIRSSCFLGNLEML